MSANTLAPNCMLCPDCQNPLGEPTGFSHHQHWNEDMGGLMPPFCPTCNGRGYISKRQAKRMKQQRLFIQQITRNFAAEHPEKTAFFTDEFIIYAAIGLTALMLNGYKLPDALRMSLTCAFIDFDCVGKGYSDDDES